MKSHAYRNKEIAIFGLGKSGLATASRLHEGHARVAVWDDQEGRRKEAASKGVPVADYREKDWSNIDALVLSPGVPLTHPEPHDVVKKAQNSNIPVVGDVEIFLNEKTDGKIVGITGTNGKSTTSSLIHHILDANEQEAALGGNIGTPVMDLQQLSAEGTYVLELSSYQLDLTPSWHADIAVILNVTPDHLDRHGDLKHYAEVKERIFQKQSASDVAVINSDDPICQKMAEKILKSNPQKVVPISVEKELKAGVFVLNGMLHDRSQPGLDWQLDIGDIDSLRGIHNWQNAAAAVAVCRALGLSNEQIEQGLKSFGGLAHRMELILKTEKVRFVNDSKGTNAEATEKALASFDTIFWICGGVSKAGGIEPLRPLFNRVKKAFLIGEAAAEFSKSLQGSVPFGNCETLEHAVLEARKAAEALDEECVVLLSPACASFDQFPSFEARGDAFRALVLGESE